MRGGISTRCNAQWKKKNNYVIGDRLAVALAGGLALPESGIAVWHPDPSADLSAIASRDPTIIQPFKPSFDTFQRQGFATIASLDGQEFALSIVCLPRAKQEARALIALALSVTSGAIVVDGQKTDGVDSLLKAMKARVSVEGPINKAHGKLFWVKPSEKFADWHAGPALTAGGFWTAPGVFSADGIDPASALLVDALPDRLGPIVADLGAGWGFLAAHALTREGVEVVHLVEAGHLALQCAEHNVTDPRAIFHWADATSWTAPDRVDDVVMNPPFHASRAAEPGLGQAFIRAAAQVLKPDGALWMVANRHLPYETTLSEAFHKVVEFSGDAGFKLLHAHRPKRRT